MLPLDLFIGSIDSSLRRLLRGKHPQSPTCMKMQDCGIALDIEVEAQEKRAPEIKQKVSKCCWKHSRVFMHRL